LVRIPRISCCIANASADSCGLAAFSPLAAGESKNMRKLVFITICATCGTIACNTCPVAPSQVAGRVNSTIQACAIVSAASPGPSVGTFS
jgi:hypothetical protein